MPSKTSPDTRKVLALADRSEPEVAQAVADLLTSWRKGWTLTALRSLIARAPGTAADALDPSRPQHGALAALKGSDPDPLYQTLLAITTAAAEIPMGFTVINPHAVRYARTQTAQLVRMVDDATRTAIRQVIRDGMAGHLTVDQMARRLRDIVGLHPRQAQAVLNLRAQLEKRLLPEAVDRLTAGQVDRLVSAYADRQLAYRAMTIARTETIRASQQGLVAGWQAAQDDGLIPDDAVLRWLTTDPCEECESIEAAFNDEASSATGTRPIGGGVFTSHVEQPDGSVISTSAETPPLHPRCRCVLDLVIP